MKLNTASYFWSRLLGRLMPLIFVFITSSCSEKETTQPKFLAKAIDVFYLENYNDSVLSLLDYPAFMSEEKSEQNTLKTIFAAGALSEKGYPDSARNLLNTINTPPRNPKLKYYYCSIDGLVDYRQNNYEKSYKKLLLTSNTVTQDVRAQALNERIIGRILKSFTDYKSSINWFLKSKKHFQKAGLDKSVAITNKFIGSSCIKLQLFDEAVGYLTESQEAFLKYKDKDELFYVYIVLSDLYIQQNKLNQAYYYAQKASNNVNSRQDKRMLSNVYNTLGEIAMLKKSYKTSLSMFQRTLSLGENYYSAPLRRKFAYYNIGRIFNLLGQPEGAKENLLQAVESQGTMPGKLKYEIFKELAKLNVENNQLLTRQLIDSTVQSAEDYYTSQSVNILNSFKTSQELNDIKQNMEQMVANNRKQKIFLISIALFLLIIIMSLYRSVKIKNENSKILHVVAQKNLKLLEEERRLNKLIQESSKSLKTSKRTPTEEERSRMIYSDLVEWLEKENNYMRNDLNLDLVSKEISTNRDYLSRAINDQNIRFPDLINKYRINEAIHILSSKNDIRSKFNLQIIAREVGFNSYSVFVDAFRKQTGMPPVQFRDRVFDNAPSIRTKS